MNAYFGGVLRVIRSASGKVNCGFIAREGGLGRDLLQNHRTTCRYSVCRQAFMCCSLNSSVESKAVLVFRQAHNPVRYFLITAHRA